MMAKDIEIRTNSAQPIQDPDAYQVAVTETSPGLVHEENPFRIGAFPAPRGDVKLASGYKITTAEKSMVISGNTAFSEELIRQAAGADLLVHWIISESCWCCTTLCSTAKTRTGRWTKCAPTTQGRCSWRAIQMSSEALPMSNHLRSPPGCGANFSPCL